MSSAHRCHECGFLHDEHIADRCPTCGGQTLFIGEGGWLTCSVIGCKEPGVSYAIKSLRAELTRLREQVDACQKENTRLSYENDRLRNQ